MNTWLIKEVKQVTYTESGKTVKANILVDLYKNGEVVLTNVDWDDAQGYLAKQTTLKDDLYHEDLLGVGADQPHPFSAPYLEILAECYG